MRVTRCLSLFLSLAAVSCGSAQAPAPSAVNKGQALRVAFVSPAAVQPEAKSPATIWFDDFEQPGDPRQRYFEPADDASGLTPSAEAAYAGRGRGLKTQFEKGDVTRGGLKMTFGRNPLGAKVRPNEDFHEIYWRIYVQHEPGWVGNPAKLGRAICFAGPNWSEGLIGHVWGGTGDVLCIDPATGITNSKLVTTEYNDFAHLRWLGKIDGKTPLFSTAESGRWVCVESRVKVNTPGKKDGVFNLWVDGKLEASHTDLDWHGTWDAYAINAVCIENYWNQGATKREARYFDNFVISTQPIGPIVAANPPVVTRTVVDVSGWEAQVATSPEGTDVVWASKMLPGRQTSVTVDGQSGTFAGSRQGQTSLAPGGTYWLRVRAQGTDAWSDWHAPFRTAAK